MNTTNNTSQLPSMLHQRTISNLSQLSQEDLFSSITGLDDLAGQQNGIDDDLSFDDIDDSLVDSKGGPARKGKNRLASSTAEKKATHNAVERARRESLNARFLVLADMLPGMTSVKRASKAAIVNKSIDLIREMQSAEQKLLKENGQLKLELEALRARTGSPSSVTAASAATKAGSATATATANMAALAAAQEAARQQIQAQASANANANAQNASMQQQAAHQQSLFAAAAAAGMPHHMHHLAAGMPMMPHMQNAAAMAQIAAVAAAGNLQQQQQHNHNQALSNASAAAQQQQQQAAAAAAAAQQFHASQAALAAAVNAQSASAGAGDIGSHQLFPGSAGFFSGLFNAGGAFDILESARSESGSPASHGSYGSHGSSGAPFANALFDMPSSMNGYTNGLDKATGSPGASSTGAGAGYNLSPPGTVASLAGSERTQQSQISSAGSSTGGNSSNTAALTHNGSAPSPASSNGVPTPSSNAYSPIGLSHITATPQSTHASQAQGNMNDPVIAAFDGSSEVAYLASQFAPSDLAKAQHDLQAFIAYQSRMAFPQSSSNQQQGPHTPTLEHSRHASSTTGAGSPSLYPPSSSQNYSTFNQQHMQAQLPQSYGGGGNASLVAGMCGPSAAAAAAQNGMNGMPAWQMMMAQHQAMVAAYGGQQF